MQHLPGERTSFAFRPASGGTVKSQRVPKIPVHFTVLGEPASVELEPLAGRASLDAVLPALRVLDGRILDITLRKHSEPPTCAKGCSACCRVQPVPVTPLEARDLTLLVESMPEARRATVLARFEQCVSLLEAAGLASVYLEGRRADSDEQARGNARKYLDLKLACPFLDDDVCGIYDSRPFTCREYFVTTPKEFCADPLSQPVRRIPSIVSGARAALAVEAEFTGVVAYTLPLTLALEFAKTHQETLARTFPGADLLSHGVRALFASAPVRRP
jgi:Fe-S-cluster containining protein